MTENNTKLTKNYIIVGTILLVIILAAIFLKKPITKQAEKIPESNNTVSQTQNNSNYREQLVNELIGEEKQLSKNEFSHKPMVLDFFDKLITEGFLKNTEFNKQEMKMTLYLDSDILTDRKIETWITGFAMQVAGKLKNPEDFAVALNTDPDTGDIIEFTINNIVVKNAENIGGLPAWSGHEPLEATEGTEGHARILDLVINGKNFAHFETGKVFAELERLGLIGGMTKEGNIIFERKLIKN